MMALCREVVPPLNLKLLAAGAWLEPSSLGAAWA